MAYLLDANVFIEAKNRHYGFDFCPAFWDWLIDNNGAGKVFSVEKVGDELDAGSDPLAEWASERGPEFFLRPDNAMLAKLGLVSGWVTGQTYDPAALSTFLAAADFYLVAQALARGDIVVTHEIPDGARKRIKIPNVCIGLGVKCVTPFEMLRKEKARFVLGPGG
jgi:hypothetical protein